MPAPDEMNGPRSGSVPAAAQPRPRQRSKKASAEVAENTEQLRKATADLKAKIDQLEALARRDQTRTRPARPMRAIGNPVQPVTSSHRSAVSTWCERCGRSRSTTSIRIHQPGAAPYVMGLCTDCYAAHLAERPAYNRAQRRAAGHTGTGRYRY